MYTLKLKIQSLQNIDNMLSYLSKIKHFLKAKKLIIKGNIQQKKKKKIYTVLRSPHVNKKSREHFNYHVYKQTFYILNNNIYILFNFLIVIQKIIPKNIMLKAKILKN